ncbi:MAG: toxic anion resistance protein, partial [Cetobacterium sp.]
MSDEFKEEFTDIKPELTFEPFKEEKLDVKIKEEKVEEKIIDEIQLTEEEKKMVDQFVDKIEINNSNSILQYGVGAQK